MYEFKYVRPTSVRQAANMLAKDGEAKILAGGHSLIPVMKLRLARPSQLLDINQIEGLNAIELKGRSVSIGAPTSKRGLARWSSSASTAGSRFWHWAPSSWW